MGDLRPTMSVGEALRAVRSKVAAAVSQANLGFEPRLVAVSKTKPIEALLEAFEAGQRYFGENYVQELVDKAPHMPEGTSFHFIGKLQSNKAAVVAAIPNCVAVETVDTAKLAAKLNQGCPKAGRKHALNVFIQVNTSGEESKGGVNGKAAAAELVAFVRAECPQLLFTGLMTIGKPGEVSDFEELKECRAYLCEHMGIASEKCELSMGMSGDFETAVEYGSTNIRVGSSIFGGRQYPAKPAAPEEQPP